MKNISLEALKEKEWILPFGNGGYASSTYSGINTRKYHGLLVGGFLDNGQRNMYVSALEEKIIIGEKKAFLSSHKYASDTIFPDGYKYLHDYGKSPDGVWFVYSGFEDNYRVKKHISVLGGKDATRIRYEVSGGSFSLEVRPLITLRDIHEVRKDAPYSSERGDGYNTGSNFDLFPLEWSLDGQIFYLVELIAKDGSDRFFLASNSHKFLAFDQWYFKFDYEKERERGYDSIEDLYSPGRFVHDTEKIPFEVFIFRAESHDEGKSIIREFLSHQVSYEDQKKPLTLEDYRDKLQEQMLDFVVTNQSQQRSIIAGYPWFGIWSRDAMIALDGLFVPETQHIALEILDTHFQSLQDGRIPNILEEETKRFDYVADATLLLVVKAFQYFRQFGERDWFASHISDIEEILISYLQGIDGGYVDHRMFLYFEGDDKRAATWMDAIVDGKAVTPRNGAPVEIQSLWYNALKIFAEYADLFEYDTSHIDEIFDTTFHLDHSKAPDVLYLNFSRMYFSSDRGYLADVISENDEDFTLRSNQFFAMSLPFSLLDLEKSKRIFDEVSDELLTPVGLRTLGRNEPGYSPEYHGTQRERDLAYHQGTIWPWLLGTYFVGYLHTYPERIDEVREYFVRFFEYIEGMNLDMIPEVFSAESLDPGGSFHQAWSTSEILKILRLITKKEGK